MKKALYLFFVYIVVFVLMTLTAAYIHMQEIQLSQLVAGTKLSFFNPSLFLKGLITYFPFCGALSLLPFCFYIVRHKFKVLEYIFTYIIICLVVFFVLFPLGILAKENYKSKTVLSNTNPLTLSSGYFRVSPDYIDYYISTNPDNSSEILHIAKSGTGNSLSQIKIITQNLNLSNIDSLEEEFSDPIIQEVFESKSLFKNIKGGLYFLEEKMIAAFHNGFWHFVAFMSIGLALSSVIGLRRIAKWRLLNILNMALIFFVILFLNMVLYSQRFYETVSFLEPAKKWFPIVINLVIGVVFIIVGILNAALKLDPNRESD